MLPGGTGNSVSIRSNIQEQGRVANRVLCPSFIKIYWDSQKKSCTYRPKKSIQVRAEGLKFIVLSNVKSPELSRKHEERSGLSVNGLRKSDQLTSVR